MNSTVHPLTIPHLSVNKRKEKPMHNFLLGVLLGFCLFLLEGATARSQSIGTGLICNQIAEVRMFIENWSGNTEAALAVVNEKFGSASCAVIATSYYKGDKKGEVRNREGTFDIVEIVVVGHYIGQGMFMPLRPAIQYTIFKQEGISI